MIFVSCGNESEDAPNNKGSREDPYSVGDTVKVKNAFAYDRNNEKAEYSVQIKIDEVYTSSDWTGDNIPVVKVTYRMDGNNDNSVNYGILPVHLILLDENMEETNYNPKSVNDMETLFDFYTGTDYSIYLMGDSYKLYKYLTLTYLDRKDNKKTLYVQLQK